MRSRFASDLWCVVGVAMRCAEQERGGRQAALAVGGRGALGPNSLPCHRCVRPLAGRSTSRHVECAEALSKWVVEAGCDGTNGKEEGKSSYLSSPSVRRPALAEMESTSSLSVVPVRVLYCLRLITHQQRCLPLSLAHSPAEH